MDPQNPNAPGHGQQGNRPQPVYDTSNGGHYGASAALSAQGFAPAELYTGPWANVHQGLQGNYKDILTTYWQHTINHLENDAHDYKLHQLPLARIKKVMKADPEVKMISAEAPILFAKGCDIFITELTMRAWIHAEENKAPHSAAQRHRFRSLQSDMFDFLIDIVPREEASSHAKRNTAQAQPQAQALPQQPQPGQMGQHGIPQPQPPQHAMPEYGIPGHMADQDYRQAQGMYGQPQVPQQPQQAYGQPQAPMYPEMTDPIYGYSGMPTQQAPMQSEDFE